MISRVKIISSSETTSSKMYGKRNGSSDSFLNRDVYQSLGSTLKNSSLNLDVTKSTPINEFFHDMNVLYDQLSDLTEEDRESLLIVDEYLGSLGITDEYPIAIDARGNQKKINAVFIGTKES